MPLILSPSKRTVEFWGAQVAHPLRIEFFLLLDSFLVFCFALSSAIQNSLANYNDAGDDYFALSLSYYAGEVSLNIVPPLVTMTLASIDVFYLSTSLLHPVYVIVMSIVMCLGWATSMAFVIIGAGPGGGFNNVEGPYWLEKLDLSTNIMELLFSGCAALVYFLYTIFAAAALHEHKRQGKGRRIGLHFGDEKREGDVESNEDTRRLEPSSTGEPESTEPSNGSSDDTAQTRVAELRAKSVGPLELTPDNMRLELNGSDYLVELAGEDGSKRRYKFQPDRVFDGTSEST